MAVGHGASVKCWLILLYWHCSVGLPELVPTGTAASPKLQLHLHILLAGVEKLPVSSHPGELV